MKPLFLRQAEIKTAYASGKPQPHEVVEEGNQIALFITRDTPIGITPDKAGGLRERDGYACRVHIGDNGYLVFGLVAEIAEKISNHLEETSQ